MSEDKDIVTESLPPKKEERIKNPKKVLAGLRLARINLEAREALAREKAREASSSELESDSSKKEHAITPGSISWQHLIGFGGLAIVAAGLYLQWRKTTPTPVVTDMPSRVEPRVEKHSTPPMV